MSVVCIVFGPPKQNKNTNVHRNPNQEYVWVSNHSLKEKRSYKTIKHGQSGKILRNVVAHHALLESTSKDKTPSGMGHVCYWLVGILPACDIVLSRRQGGSAYGFMAIYLSRLWLPVMLNNTSGRV